MKIKATIPSLPANVNGGKSLVEEIEYDIPNTQEGLNKKFGADYMLDLQKKALVIQIQAFMRGKMVKKEEGEITGVGLRGKELQAAVGEYKPKLRTPGKSIIDRFKEKAATMSEEDKRQLLAELQGTVTSPRASGNTRPPAKQGSTPRGQTQGAGPSRPAAKTVTRRQVA